MAVDKIRQTVMRRRTEQGFAVICAMPDREPVALYFANPETRDDFMRRTVLNGATVEIVTATA